MIRKRRVVVDADLALLYGVTTKRLNEQVKRNAARFPGDFMFRLDAHQKAEVVANCDHLAKLKFSKVLPYAFTEHGAIQAANVPFAESESRLAHFETRRRHCVLAFSARPTGTALRSLI